MSNSVLKHIANFLYINLDKFTLSPENRYVSSHLHKIVHFKHKTF